MIAISSRSAGVLLLPRPATGEYAVLDLVGGEQHDPIDAQYIYCAAQDWEEIEDIDAKALMEAATREYWLTRTVSLLRSAIRGLEEDLEKIVLEHVEELLGSRVSSENALDRLLVASLADPRSPLAAAKSALSCNFSAVASIFEDLAELQPLLRRFADLWLGLPASAFGHFSESRETIWMTLIEKGRMRSLLEAGNRRDFTTQWNLLAFHFPSYQSRSGIGLLGQDLSRLLFPAGEHVEIMDVPLAQGTEPVPGHQRDRAINVYEAFESVKKQITAIALAVSQGHDAKAEKFLRELIQEQTSSSHGEGFAVKSLCNIAQRCADMFRIDFEAICLGEALRLHPSDPWALVQYGDHLKRVGNYDKAIETFDRAEQFGESDIARSSKADVYSQQGDYARAIHTYKTIAGWSEDPILRTAIADNLRRMGRLEEAQQVYGELIRSLQQGLPDSASSEARALAGMAEIAKKLGKFEVALDIYRGILERGGVEDRDKAFYKLGLGNVLKLMGEFHEAYEVVEDVIQQYPFAMEARFTRGSILGLIGRELEGLKDLPESSGSSCWREWLRRYYRGLLLFKLKRYGDAKKNLVDQLSRAIASGEEKGILRMAAALSFLGANEISKAEEVLSKIPNLVDCHAQYLSLVLKLHSATQRRDLATINSLRERIARSQVVDVRLAKAIAALGEGNFPLALDYETDALLQLAA